MLINIVLIGYGVICMFIYRYIFVVYKVNYGVMVIKSIGKGYLKVRVGDDWGWIWL